MANIKEQLLTPEEGWQRIDDSDSNIIYNGTGWVTEQKDAFASSYNSTRHYNNQGNITFYFYGSKIRILCGSYPTRSTSINIDIDNINYTFSENYKTVTTPSVQEIVYEKVDLNKELHKVMIYLSENDTKYYELDAIDIDDDGFLLNETVYNYIRNLQPSSNETIVFNKVKKANLPNTTDNKFAIYFTDNGEIYINDKDGNVVPAINFKTEFLSNNDYKTLQDNNNVDNTKLYMVATDETLNNTKKMNLYYNNQRYVVNNDTVDKSYEVQQKVSLNVTPTEPIQIYTNDSNNKIMIDNYKFVEGEKGITSVLKKFNNTNKNNFIYNKDEIDFNDTNMIIKNKYKLSNNLNSDTDLYESEIINKNDFIEISEVINNV